MPSPPPRPLALTMGEPGGVGGELTVAAWRALAAVGPAFFVVDDPERLAALGAPVARIGAPEDAAMVFRSALPVLPLPQPVAATPGRASASTADAVVLSIETATRLALGGRAAAVVTNPIQKAALAGPRFPYPGHTEFLAALTADAPMPDARLRGPVMMIAGPSLRVVPVTVHRPLVEAIRTLTAEMIAHAGSTTAEALRRDFGIAAPRLAVAGVNPHAGEGGLLGAEDERVVRPAVDALRARGIDARGPLPADTMFHAEARATYDAALCMYHDQALIPAKTLAFHESVNVTLGLPIVRTSPDHGTALDIAGKGLARADSLIAALRLAAVMAAGRAGA